VRVLIPGEAALTLSERRAVERTYCDGTGRQETTPGVTVVVENDRAQFIAGT